VSAERRAIAWADGELRQAGKRAIDVANRSGPPMKRIIFLNRFFYPDHSATSQILSDLAFQLAGNGNDIQVITSQQRYDNSRAGLPASEQIRGVAIHRVPTTQFGRSNLVGRGFDYASFYASLWRAVNRIARPGDVLVAKTDPPMLGALAMYAAKRRQSHLVNWLQDLYPEVAIRLGVPLINGRLGNALSRLRDASLRSATANVVIGEQMAAKLRALGMPENRIHVIPNWCDDETICPQPQADNPLRRAWGLGDKFVVGYSGNLGRAHEFETILGAARKLWDQPGIIFLIIGGGHFVEEFSRRINELHLDQNFRFLPYQDQATLNCSLGVPNLHWISLKPELEGLIVPSKFYSIAAVGRPMVVIAASDGELATLVQRNTCGYVIEPGDSAALADLLRRLAKDPSALPAMGKAARKMLDAHFSRRLAFEKWQRLLEMIPAATPRV
jgi:colanic acid biosynthesis glycosyl transferase WcaI